MNDLTILLSASGSPSMPGIISCFKNNGERNIKIIGIDMCDEPSAKYLVDKFYRVPPANSEEYIDLVLDICRKEKVDIYFPTISAEVTNLINRIDEFINEGIIVSVSNRKSIEIANNKFKMYEFLKENGLSVPKYCKVSSLDDFREGCELLGYPDVPVCLKIVDGSGSRGVRIIDSKQNRYQIFVNEKPNSFYVSYDDMISILSEAKIFHEMMLVDFMPGNEYTVDSLADNGNVKYIVGRENIVSLMSIAQESIVTKNDLAYEYCNKIIKLLNYDGNIGFDFMKDKEGYPVLMDINPRITATVSVIAAAGVNLPYLRIKQLLDEPLPECFIDYGTTMKRRYGEIYTNSNGEMVRI